MRIKELFNKILDAIFPKGIICNGCGKELTTDDGYSLCEKCKEEFVKVEESKANYDKTAVFSCYNYDKLVKKYVIAYKDGNSPYLSYYMAKAMAELFTKEKIECDLVCFVPSCKHVIRRRGYDAMKNIARFFAGMTNLPLEQKLERIKHPVDQTKLDFLQRKLAVKGNFTVEKDGYIDKKILIVDDLVTSGATINECSLSLKEIGGAKEVIALTFARAV